MRAYRSRQRCFAEQLGELPLGAVVVRAGTSHRDAHHPGGVRHGELVCEHQIHDLGLARRESFERDAQALSRLTAGDENVRRRMLDSLAELNRRGE